MENKESAANNRVFLTLAAILLVLSGILGWQLFEQKSLNVQKSEEIRQLTTEKDNLTSELDELLEKYQSLEEENGQLTGELEAQRQEILALKADVEKYKADSEKIKWYRAQLTSYKNKYTLLELKYDSLATVAQALSGQNVQLSADLTQQKTQNKELSTQNVGLVNKVARGAILTAYKITVDGVRGSKERPTTKVTRLDKLRICFVLSENPLAKAEKKNIYVRVVDPEGKVLTTGRDNEFNFEGGRLAYSIVKDVNYENKQMDLCLYYSNGSEAAFLEGRYSIEIYADKALIGSTSTTLR